MQFNDYQKKAKSTLLPQADNYPYLALGLSGEAGEVAEKIKKWVRDGKSAETNLDKDALTRELGDVLWYLAIMADKLGVSLDEVANGNLLKLTTRKTRNRLSGSGDYR